MSRLVEAVENVLECAGSRAVMLVDRATGHVFAGAGERSLLLPAESVSEVYQMAQEAQLAGSGHGHAEAESIVVTTSEHHYVVRPVPVPGGGTDGPLLSVVFDRSRTNLVLARRELDGRSGALLV
ncbi:hypothetical protein [Nocardiopsis nanhaiensis]